MRHALTWRLLGLLSIALTVAVFFPAAWLGQLLEKQTQGRLALGDAQGTIWNGSAFIGGAPNKSDPVTPLLPGRFSWHLSPMVLLGQVDLTLENPSALSQAIHVTGTWSQWQVSPSTILLPAERLSALGAPLNTVQLTGQMRLSWTPLQLVRQGIKLGINGVMHLDMHEIASRLSAIKPLGAYSLTLNWQDQKADLTLKTVKGPMLLSGTGNLIDGRLQFSGTAEAEKGQEERLAVLLNLLGQRRREGNKNMIALEFK